jgi:hypothetical protein
MTAANLSWYTTLVGGDVFRTRMNPRITSIYASLQVSPSTTTPSNLPMTIALQV